MSYKEIKAEDLAWNPFTQIGKGWFLVTAGDGARSNAMTVSWGGLGVWWGKNAATVYIRQNRFTKTFIDGAERFSIAAMPVHRGDARIVPESHGLHGFPFRQGRGQMAGRGPHAGGNRRRALPGGSGDRPHLPEAPRRAAHAGYVPGSIHGRAVVRRGRRQFPHHVHRGDREGVREGMRMREGRSCGSVFSVLLFTGDI